MTNKKKYYQEPILDVIKMKYCARLLEATTDPDARHQGHDFGD